MAKRKTQPPDSPVIDVAQAMGAAVGKAFAALGAVGTRRRRAKSANRPTRNTERAESADRPRRRRTPAAAPTRARTTKRR